MSKDLKHSMIGLTPEELSYAVKNSNDPAILKELEGKLENCDLSRSAIELIDENDLPAVSNISEGINSKYLGGSSSSGLAKWITGGVAAVVIVVGVFTLGGDNEDKNSFVPPVEIEDEPERIEPSKDVESAIPTEKQPEALGIEENKKEKFVEIEEETNQLKDTVENLVDEPEETLKREAEVPFVEKKKEIVMVPVKEEDFVREIIAYSNVPEKYKDDRFSVSNMIEYQGGNEALERELLGMLKGKVKFSDTAKRNKSVVFSFTVTHKGKVKDVSVLSLASPELELLIEESVMSLQNWRRGKERIPLKYTVTIALNR